MRVGQNDSGLECIQMYVVGRGVVGSSLPFPATPEGSVADEGANRRQKVKFDEDRAADTSAQPPAKRTATSSNFTSADLILLVEMGFPEDQAREALIQSRYNMQGVSR